MLLFFFILLFSFIKNIIAEENIIIENIIAEENIIFIHGYGGGMNSQVKHVDESYLHKIENYFYFKYPDKLSRKNRIDAGKKLYDLVREKKIDIQGINFQVHSYGIEVFISFLEQVVENNEIIKSVYLWGSPVTEWTCKTLQKINIDDCIKESMNLYYSNKDLNQVIDITQTFDTCKFWKWRLFYAIRHTLPLLSNKIKNINCGDSFEHNSIKFDQCKNLQADKEDKKCFRFYHFGKIEKLIFIFSILFCLRKKIPDVIFFFKVIKDKIKKIFNY